MDNDCEERRKRDEELAELALLYWLNKPSGATEEDNPGCGCVALVSILTAIVFWIVVFGILWSLFGGK